MHISNVSLQYERRVDVIERVVDSIVQHVIINCTDALTTTSALTRTIKLYIHGYSAANKRKQVIHCGDVTRDPPLTI